MLFKHISQGSLIYNRRGPWESSSETLSLCTLRSCGPCDLLRVTHLVADLVRDSSQVHKQKALVMLNMCAGVKILLVDKE